MLVCCPVVVELLDWVPHGAYIRFKTFWTILGGGMHKARMLRTSFSLLDNQSMKFCSEMKYWRSLNMHVTVTVIQTHPQFCRMILVSLFFGVQFPLFHAYWFVASFLVRSATSIMLVLGHFSVLFRLTKIMSIEKFSVLQYTTRLCKMLPAISNPAIVGVTMSTVHSKPCGYVALKHWGIGNCIALLQQLEKVFPAPKGGKAHKCPKKGEERAKWLCKVGQLPFFFLVQKYWNGCLGMGTD